MGSFYVRKWRTQTGGVLSPEGTFTPKTDSPSAQKFRHGLIVSDSDHKHYFPMPNRSNRPEFEFVCDMEGRGHADSTGVPCSVSSEQALPRYAISTQRLVVPTRA